MNSTLSETERRTTLSIYFFITILPFILLYWMAPFVTDITLGADYQLFSINEQMELLFSIKTGSFPLYVPGYKYGHSSSALTLSQVYHPISHLASLMPGYWSGKALEWNTFLRFLTLGLTHLALFVFLRKIRLNRLFSFLLSLITVYNIRMLEAFRYGASLEAYTGYLLICAFIGLYFIRPSRWLGPLSIIGATYLLVCSGHPPMMFYGLLGAGLFTLIAPFFLTTMLPDRDVSLKIALRFWARVGLYMCVGILLASAYILPFYFEFVTTNIEYTHYNLESYLGQDTFVGVLNNFFMPFASNVISGFGGSSLFLIPLLLPLLLFFRVKIPPSIWAIWGIVLIALFYILGIQTPVFGLAWEYLPFVSSAGNEGRISLIVPIFLMMLLAWVINSGSFPIRLKGLSVLLKPYTLLGLTALILIPIYLLPVFLFKPQLGNFTSHFIRQIPFWIEFAAVLFGMASLAVLVLYGIHLRLARTLGVLLCLMILLQVGTILKYGIFIEKKYEKPTFEQMMAHKKEKIDFHFHQNPAMFHSVVLTHLTRSFIEPFLGKIYTQIIPVSSRDDAYRMMERVRLPQQVFVEGYDSAKAESISENGENVKEGAVNLIYSSFNCVKFRTVSPVTAFFGLSYPFTGHWKAWVNGEEAIVYRANGAAISVEIPEGNSLVEFRYWSNAFFLGMIISCTVFAFIGFFVCFRGLKGFPRILGIVVIAIIIAGGFMLWFNSLYRGDNLETEYSWTYTSPLQVPNLAYGKKNLSYYLYNSSMLRFDSGRAVDGDTHQGSGVTIRPLDEALIVDLNMVEEIKTIVLYGEWKIRPKIFLSQDNMKWQEVESFMEDNNTVPLRITFEKPESARFVKVQSTDSEFVIDEIEVYGPEFTKF